MLRATAGRTADSSHNKTHFAYRFLVVQDTTVWRFVDQEVQQGARRQISGKTNQIVPYGLPAVQANQIIPYRLQPYKPIRSFHTDYQPYKPIGSFHTDYEAVQANQIVPYGLRSRTSLSDRSIRTTSRTIQSYRSIWTTSRTSQSDRFIQTTSRTSQSDCYRLLGRSPARIFQKRSSHSHDHRSHEWRNQKKFQKRPIHRTIQNQTVRPSSLSGLRTKAVPCTHKPPRAHKLLYAKIHIQSYAISQFTRKAILCTHKALREHKSLTRKAVLTRTQ